MADLGHTYADERLDILEKKIKREFGKAGKEIEKNANSFFEQFKKADEERKKLVEEEKMSERSYKRWRKKEIQNAPKYEAMQDNIAKTLGDTHEVATSMINKHTIDVATYNANFSNFVAEMSTDVSFSLYDERTIANLIKNNPDLYDIRARRKIKAQYRWNKKQINSSITQGLLQGDSMDKIAGRLQNVTGMNARQALRNARTYTTSAECAGRMISYEEAKERGLEVKQMWMATHDTRTRETHADLDGEVVEVGEEFSNGLKYPADPSGDAGEVYNCRCTTVAVFDDSTFASDYDTEQFEYWESLKKKEEDGKE